MYFSFLPLERAAMKHNRLISYFKSIGKMNTNDSIFHISIWVCFAFIIFYFGGSFLLSVLDIHIFDQCYFYQETHLYCPGCGGTRSIICIFKGDFLGSIYYNAFVTYFFILYLVFLISGCLSRISHKRIPALNLSKWMFILGLLICVIQFIIKNTIMYNKL